MADTFSERSLCVYLSLLRVCVCLVVVVSVCQNAESRWFIFGICRLRLIARTTMRVESKVF